MNLTARTVLTVGVLLAALGVLCAPGVQIYDGVRAPEGLYFLSYSQLYYARDFMDSEGEAAVRDLDLTSVQQLLRLSWYTRDVLLTAVVPVGYIEAGHFDQHDGGVGDVLFGAGAFLPVKALDVLPMVVATAPTGENDPDRNINEGTGQWNIRPSVFAHKTLEPYTFDAAVRYNMRQENEDADYHPGDEWYFEAMATRKFGDFRIGPAVTALRGRNDRLAGATVPDSGDRRVSMGLEAYTKFAGLSTTFTYMADAYAENAARGHLFMVKLTKKIW